MTTPISRRQFWHIPLGDFAKNVLVGKKRAEERSRVIRPPGAIPDPGFLDVCERCGGCANACPHDAVDLQGPEGGRGEGSPLLKPQETPCRWCPSWDCIHACPTGALTLPKTGQPGPMAKAVLEVSACLVSQNILCDDCIPQCPSTIGAIRQKGKFPVIDEALCTGCGLCSYYCAADPAAIRIVPL